MTSRSVIGRASLLLVACVATNVEPARAETPPAQVDPHWTIVVHGDIAVRYPVDRYAVTLGASETVDIPLEGLEERHVVISRIEADGRVQTGVMVLSETASVLVNGQAVDEFLVLEPDDLLKVGPYFVAVYLGSECEQDEGCAGTPLGWPVTSGEVTFEVTVSTTDGVDILRQRVRAGTVTFGAAEDVTVRVDDLYDTHAIVRLSSRTVSVEAIDGAVFVDGTFVEQPTEIGPDDTLQIGPYVVEFAEVEAIDGKVAANQAVAARRDEFAQAAYTFCHDESFGKNDPRVARRMCALLDESTAETCPAAQKSCPWGRVTSESSWFPRIPIPGALLQLAFVAALVLIVVWFVVVMVRAAMSEDFQPEKIETEPLAVDMQRLPEARGQILMRQAKEAFEAGDPIRSAVLAHLAILRHLDDSGLARYHPSKTNGDYARAIRRHKPLQALFRRISRQTERVRFGDGAVDPAEVRAVIQAGPDQLRAAGPAAAGESGGGPTRPSGATGVLLVALTATASCQPWAGRPYHAHGPADMAALPALLGAAGLEVDIGRWKWSDLPPDTGVIVLRTSAALAGRWPSSLQIDHLLQSRPVVIIDDAFGSRFMLNETRRTPYPTEATQRTYSVPQRAGPCVPSALVSADLAPVTLLDQSAIEVLPVDRVITSSISAFPQRMRPLVGAVETSSTGGSAILWAAHRYGKPSTSCLYILAGRTLFTNAALTRAENAAFVAAFFASIASPNQRVALFDRLDRRMDTDAGEGADGSGRALIASNMLPFLVQTLASLILLMLAAGAAFGPLRDAVVQRHKAFVEHVEALGRHYARAGNRGLSHSAHALARLVVTQNRDRVRSGTAGGWRALVRNLAEKHDLPEEDVLVALRLGVEGTTELGTPSPSDPPPHSPKILQTLSRLLSGRDAARHLAAHRPVFRKPRAGDP